MKQLNLLILFSFILLIFVSKSVYASNINNVYMFNYNLQAFIGEIEFKDLFVNKNKFSKKSIGSSYARNQLVPNVLVDGVILYTVNSANRLIVLNLQTKKTLVKINLNKYSKANVSGLAYLNYIIYITFLDGTIVALSEINYNVLWDNKLINPISSAPLATEDKIFVVSANTLFAFNSSNGNILWSVPASNDGVSLNKVYSASIYLGYILVGLSSGDVLVVQQDSGVLVNKYNINGMGLGLQRRNPLFGDIKSAVIGYKDAMLILSNHKTVLYNLKTKLVTWQLDFGSVNTPSIKNNIAYFVNNNNTLVAVNLDSGLAIWTTSLQSLKKSKALLFWDVKIINNSLMVTSSYGDLMLYNINNGELINNNYQFTIYSSTKENIINPPIVTSLNIIFLSSKGNLYIY